MNLDALFWQLADSGEFSDAELVALSRLLDLFAALGMTRVTLTYRQLAALWGYKAGSDDKSVRHMLSTFRERVPWLGVIYYNKNAVLGLRWDKMISDKPEVRGKNAELCGESAESGGLDGNSAVNSRRCAETSGMRAENARKAGGTIRGDWLLGFSPHPVRVSVLLERDMAQVRADDSATNQASNNRAMVSALLPRFLRENSAQTPRNLCALTLAEEVFRADSACLPRQIRAEPRPTEGFRANSAQMPRDFRANSTAANVPDDLLRAVLDALDALPPKSGVSEASARAIIADALARGVAPDAILAVALAVGTRATGGANVGGGLFRSLVEKPDPAREVPRAFLAQAREMLGLEPREEGKNAPDLDIKVEIVGNPDYDPREIWEKARERLKGELGHSEFNTWLRDSVLLAWEDDVFVVGVPNAFAKSWVRNRLDGRVRAALQAAVGRNNVDVRYAVSTRRASNTRKARVETKTTSVGSTLT